MSALDERRAEARIGSPSDVGLMLQRSMSMANGCLDLLEDEYIEFRTNGRGVPKGFEKRLTDLANLLDALTLSYSRYRKAEKEWTNSMGPEEKLDAVADFAVAFYKERPDYVARWLNRLVTAIQSAGDSTRSRAEMLEAQKPQKHKLTVDELIDQAAEKSPGSWADE